MDAKYYDERYFGSSRIFGSAAPVLDQPAYERPEPEVEARPKERVSIRTEAKPIARQRVSLFAVGGCIAIAGLAIMLLLNYVELNAISSRTYELSSRLQELKTEETRLKIEYESTFKLDEVEQSKDEEPDELPVEELLTVEERLARLEQAVFGVGGDTNG